MIRVNQAICFTGHRKMHSVDWETVRTRLRAEIISAVMRGYRDFISGCALGTDTIAFYLVEEVRNMPEFKHLGIRNILAIPFIGFDARWKEQDRHVYHNMLHLCDEFYIVDQIQFYSSQKVYEKLQKRNEFMIDYSSEVIAVHEPNRTGGTYNAKLYAGLRNKYVHNII